MLGGKGDPGHTFYNEDLKNTGERACLGLLVTVAHREGRSLERPKGSGRQEGAGSGPTRAHRGLQGHICRRARRPASPPGVHVWEGPSLSRRPCGRGDGGVGGGPCPPCGWSTGWTRCHGAASPSLSSVCGVGPAHPGGRTCVLVGSVVCGPDERCHSAWSASGSISGGTDGDRVAGVGVGPFPCGSARDAPPEGAQRRPLPAVSPRTQHVHCARSGPGRHVRHEALMLRWWRDGKQVPRAAA